MTIEVGEHYRVTVRIDTDLNPPITTAREAIARPRFDALHAE